MAVQDFEVLFDVWGDDITNIGAKYVKCCKQRDAFERRNTRSMLIKTRKRVLGRADRIYTRIRTLNQY